MANHSWIFPGSAAHLFRREVPQSLFDLMGGNSGPLCAAMHHIRMLQRAINPFFACRSAL